MRRALNSVTGRIWQNKAADEQDPPQRRASLSQQVVQRFEEKISVHPDLHIASELANTFITEGVNESHTQAPFMHAYLQAYIALVELDRIILANKQPPRDHKLEYRACDYTPHAERERISVPKMFRDAISRKKPTLTEKLKSSIDGEIALNQPDPFQVLTEILYRRLKKLSKPTKDQDNAEDQDNAKELTGSWKKDALKATIHNFLESNPTPGAKASDQLYRSKVSLFMQELSKAATAEDFEELVKKLPYARVSDPTLLSIDVDERKEEIEASKAGRKELMRTSEPVRPDPKKASSLGTCGMFATAAAVAAAAALTLAANPVITEAIKDTLGLGSSNP